jgi:hypothetical protein
LAPTQLNSATPRNKGWLCSTWPHLSVTAHNSEDALSASLSQVIQDLRQALRGVGCVNNNCKVLRQLGGGCWLLLPFLWVKQLKVVVDHLTPAAAGHMTASTPNGMSLATHLAVAIELK